MVSEDIGSVSSKFTVVESKAWQFLCKGWFTWSLWPYSQCPDFPVLISETSWSTKSFFYFFFIPLPVQLSSSLFVPNHLPTFKDFCTSIIRWLDEPSKLEHTRFLSLIISSIDKNVNQWQNSSLSGAQHRLPKCSWSRTKCPCSHLSMHN